MFCALQYQMVQVHVSNPIIFGDVTSFYDNVIDNNRYGEETTGHGSKLQTILIGTVY